ncbi:hypothetical protein ACQCN2_17360 [Brevibacillus ginsengisoli]|uniref:hypothetical protein n=1 Tax=Brevibacillus ginsengisoli TaxID=363854 RepID=UPI003CE76409
MLTKWVTIHQSYGLPRAAQEFRRYLEHHGIQTQLLVKSKGNVSLYVIQVPQSQKEKALKVLEKYKQGLH